MKPRALAAASACAAAAAGAWFFLALPEAPSFARVRADYRRSDATLLDRSGRPLQERRVDRRSRALAWTPLGAVSPALPSAVLMSEDGRFYAHGGVDAASALAAAWGRLRGARRGASTVTMQLAARLDPSLRRGRGGRTPAQKLGQMRLAWALERRWSKAQILEAYLNLCLSRGELTGVAALSRGLFGKFPDGLDDDESAVLAALPREPGASPRRAAARAAFLEGRLGERVDGRRLLALARRALTRPPRVPPVDDDAPAAARLLLPAAVSAHESAPSVVSSLDGRLQRYASAVLRARLGELAGRNARDAAALVVDNRTGEVLAYVGNTGSESSARWVDGVRAPRQAGSTLKPFLYALAFERRLITPATPLDDSPLEIATSRGLYRPEDYDHSFMGPIPAATALASSVNVPAVRLLELAGEDAFAARLADAGLTGLRDASDYGPSLALGTADVRLWDLVSAYRTLARGGLAGPLTLRPARGPAPARRAFSPQAAFLVADILSDRENRGATFGLDSVLATPYWSAVKTGTSKDMRDNWCVGFTPRYTVGVWVGNFSGAPMWDVSGISGAAPAWRDLLDYLSAGNPAPAPTPPPGLARRSVLFAGERRERWFLSGTQPEDGRVELAAPRARVVRPVSGTVVALDPDIPASVQRVDFESDGAAGLRWRLNGRDLGPADRALEWPPQPGDYALSLVDGTGREVDRASFRVRGALAAARR